MASVGEWISSVICVLCIALLHSVICQNADQCTPEQVHISYGDSASEVVVMWSTKGQCATEVKYADKPWHLDKSTPGESRMFNDASNKAGMQVIHRVRLMGLSPDTTYYYQPSSNGYSVGPYFFQTPSKDKDKELQLMVFSDLNSTSPSLMPLTVEAMSGKYAAILHAGNIAMNLSSGDGMNGDSYMKLMERAIKSVPYMTSPGPAEVEGDIFGHYSHRFSMPQSGWPISIDKMWYSVDIGLVHLISYSTEVFYSAQGRYASMQHDWLIKDLKLANDSRSKVPWIIAFGHRPMYCSYEEPDMECNKKTSQIKSGLEDIFYHYGVDIVIQSYGKAYERSYPMYMGVPVTDNYTNPLGPVHIITGGASPWEIDYNFTKPMPDWTAFRYTNDSIMTYGRLHIFNSSMLEYEQVNLKDEAVIDSFKITQEKHGQFSTTNLPPNISAEINKEILDAGGKPGVLNIEEIGGSGSSNSNVKSKIAELLQGDNWNRLVIGVSCAVFAVIAVCVIFLVRRMRRRKRVVRRWEQMDINYGKKFYSKAPDKDEDNDFEIDMSDGTEPTRKLLNADE